MKSENEWKTDLVTHFKRRNYGYARRIEDRFGVGFPDMVLRPHGWPIVVIEAKLVSSRYFAPSPRQYIDLVDLHDPPVSFGLVLGIREKDKEVIFSFSEPFKKIDDTAMSTFHHVNFYNGLMMFLSRIKEQTR